MQADGAPASAEAIARARDWIVGLQCRDGGWGAFDADNDHMYLNHIPFADHGALLDPPTADVSARCLGFLAQAGYAADHPAVAAAVAFLKREQEPDGSWFGRWGTNYIYGTWSVLIAFEQAGVAHDDPAVRRAVNWLASKQNADGGWGELNDSYHDRKQAGGPTASAPFQTAWALLGLLACGEVDSPVVRNAVRYLQRQQQKSGLWTDSRFTAPGFPRVFYLKYHGYCAYFPLWALAAYRNRVAATRPK